MSTRSHAKPLLPALVVSTLAAGALALSPLLAAAAPSDPDDVVLDDIVLDDDGIPAPMPDVEDAYEAALRETLPAVEPEDFEGLPHVVRLSPEIVTGGEPMSPAALERLRSWGVRTVISVDGKVPDHAAAAKLGLRYVHVPIQYSGFTADEELRLAKSFRELEGPFYVHCFHGKHRGPAAAALGRVLLDGAPRARAIAEMRQWCGTAESYRGLFTDIATGALPTAAASATYGYDFAPAHQPDGFRGAMVDLTRKWDLMKAARRNGWAADPAHPDVVPAEEARQFRDLFALCAELDTAAAGEADFLAWMGESRVAADDLLEALRGLTAEADDPDAVEGHQRAAGAAYSSLASSCTACHAAYRNEG